MADVKWIKINTDMFDNSKIKYIRRAPGGNDIIILWVMLLTKAGKCNSHGYIMLTENMPYDAEMLATEFDMELSTVRFALTMFKKLNMIDIENETIVISGWNEHQSLEKIEIAKEKNRLRQKRFKEKQRQKLIGNVTDNARVTENNSTEEELELELELELDKELEKELLQVVVVENKNKNIFEIYEQCGFGLLNKYIADELVELVKEYSFSWVKESLENAAEQGKYKISYAKGILKNWKADGKVSKDGTGARCNTGTDNEIEEKYKNYNFG